MSLIPPPPSRPVPVPVMEPKKLYIPLPPSHPVPIPESSKSQSIPPPPSRPVPLPPSHYERASPSKCTCGCGYSQIVCKIATKMKIKMDNENPIPYKKDSTRRTSSL
jgi:hypothetical protein